MSTDKLGWRKHSDHFTIAPWHSQVLGCGACQVGYSLNTFSWTLTLYIRIANRGGTTCLKKKKIVFLVCVVEVKPKEAADVFAAMDFDRKFAGSQSWKVLSQLCLSSMNLPRNSVCCKTTVNSFKKPSSPQLGHVWSHTVFFKILFSDAKI